MTTPDLTTLRAALAPALAQQLWQLLAAGSRGQTAGQLSEACKQDG